MESDKSPTVVPVTPFDAKKDAKSLHSALAGMFKPNKKAIIEIVTKRSNSQRLQIAEAYKELYKKDLIDKFRKKLMGDFKDLVLTLMIRLMPDFYVKELHYAMDRFDTIEAILIEILCSLTNDEIKQIKVKYKEEYGETLESTIKGETGGVFRRLMQSLCRAERDESKTVDPLAAEYTARRLYEAGAGRPGTDESVFIRVFCYRNYEQLKLIFEHYEDISGRAIEDAVKDEFSGDCEKVLLAIIDVAKNPSMFFAKKLNQSMKGLGTNDRQLIRIVITRSEIDMTDIKKQFSVRYGESLANAIRGDCSGSYKRCLLALIGEKHTK